MSSFVPVARALAERGVRYVLIGVSGANLHAHRAGVVFTTQDRDVFLPPDPENLLGAWEACESTGLTLSGSGEPLGPPRDLVLAARVVERRAQTRASDGDGLLVDLVLEMAGFSFDEVWRERVPFRLGGVSVPVARLAHLVASKARAGRAKDRLFLATHEDALRQLLGAGDAEPPEGQ